jgi:hypothetical protein
MVREYRDNEKKKKKEIAADYCSKLEAFDRGRFLAYAKSVPKVLVFWHTLSLISRTSPVPKFPWDLYNNSTALRRLEIFLVHSLYDLWGFVGIHIGLRVYLLGIQNSNH